MRGPSRPTRSIGFALAVVSCLPLGFVAGPAPTTDELNTPLTSVLRRSAHVFASTPNGIFRASLKTKRWEKLNMPVGMPKNGRFAEMPDRSPLVLYVASPSELHDQRRPGDRLGLYLSRDDGATWELVTERDDLGPACLLPDGGLFIIARYSGELNGGDRLLRSTDLGKTWRDVPGDWHLCLLGVGPDPYHPGLVWLYARDALRPYTILADDANYRWRIVRGTVHSIGRLPSDEFFSRGASGGASGAKRFYVYNATLANYFRYDFGNATNVHAFEVVPRKTRFEFAKGDRVVVPIQVVFLDDWDLVLARWRKSMAEGHPSPKPTPSTEKIADLPGGTECWSVRVETPEVQWPSRDHADTAPPRERPRVAFQIFELSPSRPYERELDLSNLYDFSRPGEYRVQLIYGSPDGLDRDRNKDVWDGSFTSPVFTVVVRK